ncbi:purine-nucleoside phosphorylase [Haloferula chungangensis]|uniref:purine-nucleoside phosphorylase n=1 Tax=Haloferula chungangensis TaxID=1048331 RepID=A0ABW2L1J8_9BACT
MSEAIGLVLGSGLGSLADQVDVRETVAFSKAGLPVSTVPGHEGAFLLGSFAGREVVVMRGRVHLYEGHSAQALTQGVRWMHERGVGSLILTNAAGSVNAGFEAGAWMMLSDHLNLTGTSPLEGAPQFVDLSEVYSESWRDRLRRKAEARGMNLYEGVYAGLRGPQYETPAEVRMLRMLGADAVGMSTVLEAIQARALGMQVLGLSCLTNWAAGMPGAQLDHHDVVETGQRAAAEMVALLKDLLGDPA